MLLCSTFDHCRLSVGRIGQVRGKFRWLLDPVEGTEVALEAHRSYRERRPREAEVEPRLLLVYFLRETLGLTGTNVGCDTSSCGACTVMMDGKSVKSCTVLAVQADGAEVTTIEGLASNGQLHPLQESFRKNHGLQCGFCTPGMIMAGVGLIESGASMEDEDVRLGLEGNLCRCTGYQNIVKAIQEAAGEMRQAAPAAVQGGSE